MSHSGRPRSITGSDGTRVKLLLGATGEDYILLLDEDDGKREWQSSDWSGNLPSKLCKQINNCYAKYRHVTEMAFGPTGQWYVSGSKRSADRTLYGGHHWWGGISDDTHNIKKFCTAPGKSRFSFGCNGSYVGLSGSNGYILYAVPEGLKARVKKAHQKSETIKVARVFQHSGAAYFVSDAKGTEWCGLSSQLSDHLKNGGKDEIVDVICAADGSWVVLRPNRFVASNGVSSKVRDRLDKFFQQQKSRRQDTNRRIKAYDAALLRQQQEAEAEAARQAHAVQSALQAEQRRQAEVRQPKLNNVPLFVTRTHANLHHHSRYSFT